MAASSCVPGAIDPVTLKGFYKDQIIQLVDGGVHDNQGLATLLDENCNVLICSDAAGQLYDKKGVGIGGGTIGLRASDVMMDRMREEQFQKILSLKEGQALQGVCYVHLKQEIKNKELNSFFPALGTVFGSDESTLAPSSLTKLPYLISENIQKILSSMRTNLDSFSEVEANALMTSGYLMTRYQLGKLQLEHAKNNVTKYWGGFSNLEELAKKDFKNNDGQIVWQPDLNLTLDQWDFLKIADLMTDNTQGKSPSVHEKQKADLEKQLKISSKKFFKYWMLIPGWEIVFAIILIPLILSGVPMILKLFLCWPFATACILVLAIFLICLTLFGNQFNRFLVRIWLWMAFLFFGFEYLTSFCFLRRGRLSRLLKLK